MSSNGIFAEVMQKLQTYSTDEIDTREKMDRWQENI